MKAGKSRRADLGRAANPWNKPMEGLKEKCHIGHFPKRRCRFGTRWLKTRKDGGPPGRFEFPGVFCLFQPRAGRRGNRSRRQEKIVHSTARTMPQGFLRYETPDPAGGNSRSGRPKHGAPGEGLIRIRHPTGLNFVRDRPLPPAKKRRPPFTGAPAHHL